MMGMFTRNYFGDLKRQIMSAAQNPFARNVAINSAGTVTATAITVAFMPFITRLYAPEALGVLSVFIAIIAMAMPLTALTYPLAIVLPKDEASALGLVCLSLYISVAVVTLAAIIIGCYGTSLATSFNLTTIIPFLGLLPLMMLSSSAIEIGQQWLIRRERFMVLAVIAVVYSLVLNLAKALAGWTNPVASTLIMVTLACSFLSVILVIASQILEGACSNISLGSFKIPRQKIAALARKYSDFPFYRAPQIAINAISQNVPIIILSGLFGVSSAGLYALCRGVLEVPALLVGNAVADAFYPRVARAARNGEQVAPLLLRATLGLLLIGGLAFVVIALWGPTLFVLAFGNEWERAGEYARWLSLMAWLGLANKPSVAAIPTLNLQRGLLFYECFSTSSKFIALIVGFYFFESDIIAVAIFSVSGFIAYSYLIGWVLWSSRRVETSQVRG